MPKRYDWLLITKNEICGCQLREVYFFDGFVWLPQEKFCNFVGLFALCQKAT